MHHINRRTESCAPPARHRSATALLCCAAALLTLPACNALLPQGEAVGELRPVSLAGEAITVPSTFTTAIYSDQLDSDTSFYVSDRSVDELISGEFDVGQVVRIDVLWQPHPGKTPLDRSATNVSIRYVVFADGEVGIYEGGGFAITKKSLLSDKVSVAVLDASLRLGESTSGFNDLLGPTQLTGKFTATLDAATARRLHFTLSQRVTDALGETTLVDMDGTDSLRIATSK